MKSLDVMYYRLFDRWMGLWIINEFLKELYYFTVTGEDQSHDKTEDCSDFICLYSSLFSKLFKPVSSFK